MKTRVVNVTSKLAPIRRHIASSLRSKWFESVADGPFGDSATGPQFFNFLIFSTACSITNGLPPKQAISRLTPSALM